MSTRSPVPHTMWSNPSLETITIHQALTTYQTETTRAEEGSRSTAICTGRSAPFTAHGSTDLLAMGGHGTMDVYWVDFRRDQLERHLDEVQHLSLRKSGIYWICVVGTCSVGWIKRQTVVNKCFQCLNGANHGGATERTNASCRAH